MNQSFKRLNLGCGHDIKSGWINVDSINLPGVDIVHDLNQLPLPFKNNQFEEILCQDVLEHLEYIPVLKEIHRILDVGGQIKIRVPHFTSRVNFMDPTHKKMFSIRTFDFFTKTSFKNRAYYFDFHFTKVVEAKIIFEHSLKWFAFNHLVSFLVNHSRKAQDWYEATGFSRLFPAQNIIVTLLK
ncbi:MAG: methyltransferase domain-containing protein [Candidatus Paceibacterota bacterium]|jgi:ubiquinone/menaquinone biosynthesis C-methylase UbiE